MSVNPEDGATGGVVLAVAGGIVAFLAAGLLVAGAALIWLGTQRDDDGYFTTGPHHFESPTFAISSQGIEVVADAPRWLFDADRLDTVRIRSTQSSKPIFVGVAPAGEAARFLADVPHEVATQVGTSPFDVTYNQAIGSRPPQPPGTATFWVAHAVLPGTGTLTWEVQRGNWAVVVMNADASAGINARLELGAKVSFLAPTGVGLTAAGGILLVAGLGGVVWGLRHRLTRPPAIPPPPGVPESELGNL